MFLSVSMGIPFHEVRQWSSAEILLYQCYYRTNPWGVERDDIRTANQTSFIASATGVKKEGGGNFTIQDFMPFGEKSEPKSTQDEILEGLKAMSSRK